jgi:hypothetical protein
VCYICSFFYNSRPINQHLNAVFIFCLNLNRPLDLCDVTNEITLPNHQGSVGPSTPSNLNSRLPGSPAMVLGNNSPFPSTLSSPR